MALYRDSQLGLCLDLAGPDGNIFFIMGCGDDLARQLGKKEEWKQAVAALRFMGTSYISHLYLFKEFFPIITLVGFDEIVRLHETIEEVLEED